MKQNRFMSGRLRRRQDAAGMACLKCLATRPLAPSQMTLQCRLWCSQSGLAERMGAGNDSLWRITDKGRALLMRQGRQPIMSGRVVDLALILAAAIILAPIVWVGMRPVFAPRQPVVGKFTLRAGPTGLRAAAREAR